MSDKSSKNKVEIKSKVKIKRKITSIFLNFIIYIMNFMNLKDDINGCIVFFMLLCLKYQQKKQMLFNFFYKIERRHGIITS